MAAGEWDPLQEKRLLLMGRRNTACGYSFFISALCSAPAPAARLPGVTGRYTISVRLFGKCAALHQKDLLLFPDSRIIEVSYHRASTTPLHGLVTSKKGGSSTADLRCGSVETCRNAAAMHTGSRESGS